jgi:hypothetical protein
MRLARIAKGVRIMEPNQPIGELEDLAWIREAPQLGGGRVDFALIMGGLGFGIVMAQHAPVFLLLLLGTAGLAWSFSESAQLATKSWLLEVAYDWSQPAPADTEASAISDLYRQRSIELERRAIEVALGDLAAAEFDVEVRAPQIAIKRQRDAIDMALRDFAVIERNQGTRLH